MVRVNYSEYLEDQKSWAATLAERAELENGATDRESAMLAILALNRLFALSLQPTVELHGHTRQEFPEDAETRAA